MPRIQTLSHPSKRTWFQYDGDIQHGVVIQHQVKTKIPPQLFTAALQHFNGRTVAGGFSMTSPRPDGFGAWVANNAKKLAGRSLTPRHGSFIAAILVHETQVRHSVKGNAVQLHF
jgi:hypothetical protein